MRVKLRVLRGELRNQNGESAGLDLEIRGPRFIMGTAAECQMRCRSESMSPQHCELSLAGDRFSVSDLSSESGTFVNGQRIQSETLLVDGDQLRIGRLEFGISTFEDGPDDDSAPDPMSDYVSDMLDEADADDLARRMADPMLRQFDVSAEEPAEPDPADSQTVEEAKVSASRPAKKPPGKLPSPPEFVADNSVQAAEETLKKIFDRPKK
jgi:pSer/pThr/pTyr-binding forkhead associated (FHA) protein